MTLSSKKRDVAGTRGKPLSLHGLKFQEAVAALLQVNPSKKKATKKKRAKKS